MQLVFWHISEYLYKNIIWYEMQNHTNYELLFYQWYLMDNYFIKGVYQIEDIF